MNNQINVSSKINETSSNILSSRDLMEMEIGKLREYIKILEDHQIKCEDTGRFVEAEMAKSKIAQFKKIEEEKMFKDIKNQHGQQSSQLSIEFKEELDRFNELWDQEFIELNNKYEKMRKEIIENNKKEYEDKLNKFEETYPKAYKASKELLNLHSVLDNLVKRKDYKSAHSVQIQIVEMQKDESDKFFKQKEEKRLKEVSKIVTKQENEMKLFETKLSSIYSEFKKMRAQETEKILLKYNNKTKELDKVQKVEITEFKKPGRGKIDTLLRPSSKIAFKNIAISSSDQKSKNS